MKYGNKKVQIDGIVFDSRKEANRYKELKLLEYCGSIEQACTYKADFYYYDKLTNQYCCEDTKGFKTKDYIIKRKLLLYVYGIRIIEI